MRITLLALGMLLAACNKSSTPSTATPEPSAPETPVAGAPTDQRPQLTGAACEAQGGKVVGDIGDGAIHRPDYRCPDTGEPPIASIVSEAGGPVAVEGSVCCK